MTARRDLVGLGRDGPVIPGRGPGTFRRIARTTTMDIRA